eukprot:gene26397-32381_t
MVKDKYTQQYFEREGILLNKSQIKKNPGKRAVAKMYLNSLWGKFVQQLNKMKTKIINEPSDFYAMVFDEEYEMNYEFAGIEGNEKCIMNYRFKDEYFDGPENVLRAKL